MISIEELRSQVEEKKTDNERATTYLHSDLDAWRSRQITKIEEEYNANVRALHRLTDLYNDPITPPNPFPFTLVEDEKNVVDGIMVSMQPMSPTSFGLILDSTVHEFRYDVATRTTWGRM